MAPATAASPARGSAGGGRARVRRAGRAARRDLRPPRRRHGRGVRRQRGGQDDAPAHPRHAAAPARGHGDRARRRAAARGVEGARPRRPARPRAAALPRPDRAREPALPRAAAPASRPPARTRCSSASGSRRAPTTPCGRSRAAWPSAPRSAAPSCTSPTLLLLDEPLANLDPGGAAAVAPLIGASGTRACSSPTTSSRDSREADWVLGLRAGRQALWAPRPQVTVADVRGLYA